ncbi:helix-turn-helix domain-containing protein [Aerococcus sp. L_32]|uniref:helix-turn-helix domain-containing protein n=1 Tax=Aerococcus sp. L_32 TaxID=3422316 RepID=UPI003D6A40A2
MKIYDRIKILAKERNVSIAELERKLELSNGSISKWNTYMPNTEPLLKVANYFNVSVDELLGKETVEDTPTVLAIQRKARNLSEKDQEKLKLLIDAMFDD